MPARMTPTVWGQGIKNALICGIAVLAVWAIVTAAVVLIFEQSIWRSVAVSWGAIAIMTLLVFLGTWLYGRSAAGRVLLDCGPHPTWVLFVVEAFLFLFLGLSNGLHFIDGSINGPDATSVVSWFGIGLPVMMISFVPYWLIMACGRLQVRENGIWQYWSLLRWHRIGYYRWTNDATLFVRGKGIFSFFQGALPFPPEEKQAVEELLAKHCPTAASD